MNEKTNDILWVVGIVAVILALFFAGFSTGYQWRGHEVKTDTKQAIQNVLTCRNKMESKENEGEVLRVNRKRHSNKPWVCEIIDEELAELVKQWNFQKNKIIKIAKGK